MIVILYRMCMLRWLKMINTEMTTDEMIIAASYAIMKGMDYEMLYYSDMMYGQEDKTDDVWEYVVECQKEGRNAYKEKYGHLSLHI